MKTRMNQIKNDQSIFNEISDESYFSDYATRSKYSYGILKSCRIFYINF